MAKVKCCVYHKKKGATHDGPYFVTICQPSGKCPKAPEGYTAYYSVEADNCEKCEHIVSTDDKAVAYFRGLSPRLPSGKTSRRKASKRKRVRRRR